MQLPDLLWPAQSQFSQHLWHLGIVLLQFVISDLLGPEPLLLVLLGLVLVEFIQVYILTNRQRERQFLSQLPTL